jgi:hypothetical protein
MGRPFNPAKLGLRKRSQFIDALDWSRVHRCEKEDGRVCTSCARRERAKFWTMSARGGSVDYLVDAGLNSATFAAAHVANIRNEVYGISRACQHAARLCGVIRMSCGRVAADGGSVAHAARECPYAEQDVSVTIRR